MATTELTEARVKAHTSEGKPDKLIADKKQSNLYLRVLISGRKTWMLRVRIAGRWKVEKLGEWKDGGGGLSVAQARLKAAAALQHAMHGGAAAREKITLKQAYEVWFAEKVEHIYKWPRHTWHYLDRDLKPLAAKQIARITQDDLYAVLMAKRRTSPGAANKLLAITRQVFKYAVFRKWLTPAGNPMLALTHSEVGSPGRPRERVLTDAEIQRAWAIEVPHGTLYRYLLATGQRLGEVLALAEDPTQVRDEVWHIEVNKSDRPHRVPMTPMMKRLLAEGLPIKKRASAWQMWKGRMQCDATIHDIRRTVATRMRELGVAVEVIEALLNHAPPRLVRTYQRPDMTPQIAEALKLWQRHLTKLVTLPKG